MLHYFLASGKRSKTALVFHSRARPSSTTTSFAIIRFCNLSGTKLFDYMSLCSLSVAPTMMISISTKDKPSIKVRLLSLIRTQLITTQRFGTQGTQKPLIQWISSGLSGSSYIRMTQIVGLLNQSQTRGWTSHLSTRLARIRLLLNTTFLYHDYIVSNSVLGIEITR